MCIIYAQEIQKIHNNCMIRYNVLVRLGKNCKTFSLCFYETLACLRKEKKNSRAHTAKFCFIFSKVLGAGHLRHYILRNYEFYLE